MLDTPSFIHALAQLADPWKSVYSQSNVLAGIVTFAHLGAILFGGGFAVAADRATLRARYVDAPSRQRQLDELHDVHRPILIALAVLFVSGLLMVGADVEAFLASPVLWVKMALVALLVVNGGILYKTEGALRGVVVPGGSKASGEGVPREFDTLWSRLRATSVVSLVLWTSTVLAGTILMGS